MRGFFKTFFAAFLAMVVFCILGMFLFVGFLASITSKEKPTIPDKAVLVLDLSTHFREKAESNPVNAVLNGEEDDRPTLYDMVRLIRYAATDSSVKGIYILCGSNANEYAASEELRDAIRDFKAGHKFVIAYGEAITQKGYYIGCLADKLYCHPQGGVDWSGFSADLLFLKGTLDKLEIQPQIFYAGKFKSATEPLRETQMTEANRLQTSVWLGGLYSRFLQSASEARKIDTAALHALATTGTIQTANDALKHRLVDGLRYDDQVKSEISALLKIDEKKQIGFVNFTDYSNGTSWRRANGGRIALILADGDIVSGKGDNEQVGSDEFRNIIRKARMDKDIKAIVFRVNSPGGSSLASDVIWREITLARKEKPVVVSMGGVAASGGYYISCNADSVFANANTITGSIGVFSVLPNMQSFFRNKLGVTFDGVKTAPYADLGNIGRPLTEPEKRMMQAAVDSIYLTFKARVATGRKKDIGYIDSIAQGRVWTGADARKLGLVDRLGTLQDAMDCAARMAKLKEYRVKEYPEKKSFFEQLLTNYKKTIGKDVLKNEIGAEQMALIRQFKQVKQMAGEPQTRLPFTYTLR
ncbi:signal peptide peptidase SppA [Sediminibacterium soli]|uniref:signal peptide peptidase SppA n=1 Tax=Sediminibacterium soli TaxID=2698829 RepID=UPI00137AFCB2|nr:signal peptide peptidase SppA [Sediminibacterium soli]NCI45965.1 signal peptide peptidase SppA [Sediminibacterium soli]